jgi:aldose 1-epimerase
MGDRQPAAGTCAPFGRTPDGREARVWTIGVEGGLVARVSDLGACVASLLVPHDGTYLDVVLGYDDAAGYATDDAHLGAVIGRVANRIGGARLELGGRVVRLAANEGANSNHSGPDLWRRRLWRLVSAGPASVTLELDSPDGDQGFPGAVRARVTYEVTRDALRISYDAQADATTAINLTNHSYFNLNGQGSGSALGHRVQVLADRYTEVDGGNVPTGRLLDVAGTPLDLREPRRLGEASALFGREHGGFDHNYETRGFRPAEGRVGEPRRVASAWGDESGLRMDVCTDLPGLQLYTANYLDGERGKGGVAYRPHDAVCFETQFFPDAPNHPAFAQDVFGPQRPFVSTTEYRFDGE